VEGSVASPTEVHNLWFTAGRHDLHGFSQSLLDLANLLPEDGAPAVADESLSFDLKVWPFLLQNFAVVVASDHELVRAVNDSPDHVLYPDSPRVFVFTAGADPTRGFYRDVDLRRDTLRGLSRTAEGSRGVVERKLWFGLLEGALEHESAGPPADDATRGAVSVESTSSLCGGIALHALRSVDSLPEAWKKAPLPDALGRALRSGTVALAPLDPTLGAWWEVDPDGTTRAVLGDANGLKTRRDWKPRMDFGKTYRWGKRGLPPTILRPPNRPAARPPRATPSEAKGGAPEYIPMAAGFARWMSHEVTWYVALTVAELLVVAAGFVVGNALAGGD
jgi:hypothetical protein